MVETPSQIQYILLIMLLIFIKLFCTNIVLQDNLLVEEVIPNLVTDNTNQMLTMLPSPDEIHRAVFALNKDSGRGPNGYGVVFFQTFGTSSSHMWRKQCFSFLPQDGSCQISIQTELL